MRVKILKSKYELSYGNGPFKSSLYLSLQKASFWRRSCYDFEDAKKEIKRTYRNFQDPIPKKGMKEVIVLMDMIENNKIVLKTFAWAFFSEEEVKFALFNAHFTNLHSS